MEAERKFAIDVVRKACILTKAIQQGKSLTAIEKEDKSPVTVADYASQLLVSYYMQENFPDDKLVAEENIIELRKKEKPLLDQISNLLSQHIENYSYESIVERETKPQTKTSHNRYWVLDPVDGTKGFLRGEQYAIALALIENDSPVLGVVGCPNLNINAEPEEKGSGIIAYAIKGKGARIQSVDRPDNSVRLTVSNGYDASTARIVSSVQSSQHTNDGEILALKSHLRNETDIGFFDSQAKYVMVAAGKFDLFLRIPPKHNPNYREKIWDHAAGNLIVVEAGGMVSDLHGKPFDYSDGTSLVKNYGVVVSNGRFHLDIVNFFSTGRID